MFCLVITYSGHVLEDSDTPSSLLGQSRTPMQLIVHASHTPKRAPSVKPPSSSPSSPSSLIRVHYQLDQGVRGFTSLIVSANMSAREVVERVVRNSLPAESALNYTLVLVTPKGGMCMHTYMHAHTHTHTHMHVHTYIIHTYAHTCIHTYIHIIHTYHTYIHAYIHTYTIHIHTYIHSWPC